MYERFERKIGEREIEILKRQTEANLKPSLLRFVVRSAMLLGVFTGLYGISRVFSRPIPGIVIFGILFPIGEFALFAWEMQLNQECRRAARLLKRTIAAGIVSVERVESTSALKFVEHSDEGPTYFFDVGDGKVFCFRGQEAYVIEDPPSTRFELISIPRWRMIDVVTQGDAIQDFHVIDNYDYSQIPDHEGLLDHSFADSRSRFVPPEGS